MQMYQGSGRLSDDGFAPAMFNASEAFVNGPGYNDDMGLGHKRCNCKKAKCLKLYCICFSAGVYCSGCACKECMNTLACQDTVMFERNRILQRSPRAFAPKVEQKMTGDITHKKGCRCRKSRCLKKYCECFDAGVHCSSICRCDDCHNRPDVGGAVGVGPGTGSGVGGGAGGSGGGDPGSANLARSTLGTCRPLSRTPLPISMDVDMESEPGTPAGALDMRGRDGGSGSATGQAGLRASSTPAAALNGATTTAVLSPMPITLPLPPPLQLLQARGTGDTPDAVRPESSLGLPSLLGLPGVTSSLGKHALPTASASSLPLTLPRPDAEMEAEGAEQGFRALADLAALGEGAPGTAHRANGVGAGEEGGKAGQPSPFHLVQAGNGLHPTPAMNNAAAGPCGSLPNLPPTDLGVLLMPEMLLGDPEYAHILAMHLGLDETHQMAAVKSAQILGSMLKLASSHPAFQGVAVPRPTHGLGEVLVAPVARHSPGDPGEDWGRCGDGRGVPAMDITPRAVNHQSGKGGVGEGAFCQATDTSGDQAWNGSAAGGRHELQARGQKAGVASSAAAAGAGALRLGSGNFRFNGAGPAARTSDSGCKLGAVTQEDQEGQQAHTQNQAQAAEAAAATPYEFGVVGVVPPSSRPLPAPLQPHNHTLKRSASTAHSDASGSRRNLLNPPSMSLHNVLTGEGGAEALGIDFKLGQLGAASSGCTGAGYPSVKRQRLGGGGGVDAQYLAEASSGGVGEHLRARAVAVAASPLGKGAHSIGRSRRASVGRRLGLGRPDRGDADMIESMNEIEALQALFDLGSRGSQGTPPACNQQDTASMPSPRPH